MLSNPVIIAVILAGVVAFAIGVFAAGNRRASGKPQPDQDSANDNRFRHRFNLSDLVVRLQLPQDFLQSHSPTYRTAQITKPRGGIRTLEIPDAETMKLQRAILRRLLNALDAHPFACGFEQHASIVDAALPHQGKRVVLKMDVRKFFESTTATRLQSYFENIGWQPDAAALLVKLTTNDGHLPQGAPTSPRLSNLVNAPLDEALLQLSLKHRGAYSRYADDITMSFNFSRGRPVRGVVQAAKRILRSYGYTMHGGWKLKILRQHQQQKVLGLVVNSQVALPRKTRRWLRAVRHRIESGKAATISDEQLRGWESFAAMIEKQRAE